MNKVISCTFCNSHTYNGQYYCCDQNEISCFGCKEFRCHICRQRFIKKMEQCCQCFNMFRKQHLFGDGFYKFCVSCCRKCFLEGGKFGRNKFGLAKDKFEIYEFLKKFCTGCNKFLSRAPPENRSKLKQILPLDSNLCSNCKVQPKMRGTHRNRTGISIVSPFERPFQFYNGSIFSRDQPRCVKCKMQILGSYKKIDGSKVCSFCLKQQNEQQRLLYDSRMKLRQMYRGNELEDTNETETSLNSSNKKQKKTDQFQQDSKLIRLPNGQRQVSNRMNMEQSNNQPIIQDQVGEKSFNKVKRTESWNEEIIMEPVADHEKRKLSKMSSDISEPHQILENEFHLQVSSRVKGEEELMRKPNNHHGKADIASEQEDDEIQERVPTFGPQNEPIIVEEFSNRNKVKRLESWNDEIILEPVEDYERRKKQKVTGTEKSRVSQKNQSLETTPIKRPNYENQRMNQRGEAPKHQQAYQKEELRQQQKFNFNDPLTNSRKTEETTYYKAMSPNHFQSKYSFTSQNLKESRISTKSTIKKSESSIDEQNYDRRLRSSQMFNTDKVEESSNYKRTQTARPQTAYYHDNRNYKNSTNSQKQTNPSSAYHQSYFDKSKPFPSFSSTTTTRTVNGGNAKYVPSQKPYNYQNIKNTPIRSPQREEYNYSNFPSRQQPQAVHSTTRQNYQETITSRTTTSNIRESRAQQESKNGKGSNLTQSRIAKVCFYCKNKIADSSRTFTLNSEPMCVGCWDNYNRKKFDETENRRSGYYSKYNYF